MKKLFLVLFTLIALTGCNLGDVDVNTPNVYETFAVSSDSAVLAHIDGTSAFYDSSLYACVDGLFYRLPLGPDNTGVANLDGSIATCENRLYSIVEVASTTLPFIRV